MAQQIESTKAIEEGDSVRFERTSPFGVTRWQRKKGELNEMERAVWERELEKRGALKARPAPLRTSGNGQAEVRSSGASAGAHECARVDAESRGHNAAPGSEEGHAATAAAARDPAAGDSSASPYQNRVAPRGAGHSTAIVSRECVSG